MSLGFKGLTKCSTSCSASN